MIYRCLYYSAYDCSKKQKTNRIYVYSTHSYPYLADTRLTFVRAECCASTEANASGMQRREWNTKFRNRKFALHERRSSVAAGKANGEQRTESVCDKKTQSWLAHDNSALYLYLAAKGVWSSRWETDRGGPECYQVYYVRRLSFLRLSSLSLFVSFPESCVFIAEFVYNKPKVRSSAGWLFEQMPPTQAKGGRGGDT